VLSLREAQMVDTHIAGPPAVPRDHREDVHDGCGGRGYSPGSRAPQSRKMPRYNPGATDVLVLSPT
jgi:hypothetical protein